MNSKPGRCNEEIRIAKVETIERRHLQCYRYLEIEHIRKTCTSKGDMGHLCHICGDLGHQAKGCTAANPKCLLSEALGTPSVHRMVGPTCPAPGEEKKTGGTTRESTVTSGDGKGSPPQRTADPKPARWHGGSHGSIR